MLTTLEDIKEWASSFDIKSSKITASSSGHINVKLNKAYSGELCLVSKKGLYSTRKSKTMITFTEKKDGPLDVFLGDIEKVATIVARALPELKDIGKVNNLPVFSKLMVQTVEPDLIEWSVLPHSTYTQFYAVKTSDWVNTKTTQSKLLDNSANSTFFGCYYLKAIDFAVVENTLWATPYINVRSLTWINDGQSTELPKDTSEEDEMKRIGAKISSVMKSNKRKGREVEPATDGLDTSSSISVVNYVKKTRVLE